jgi:putative ABC transport system permease protein
MMGLWNLTWKNIRNRPYRNIATMLCYAFVAGSLISAYFLIGGTTNSLDLGFSRMGSDLLVVPEEYSESVEAIILKGQPSTFSFDHQYLDVIQEVEGVDKASPQLYVQTLSASCCSIPVQLIAYDPSRDFTITPWLQTRLKRPLEKDEIIVGSRIVGDIGSKLQFYGHEFTIAGRLEPTGMGLDSSIFLRMEDAFVMAEESPLKAVQPISISRDRISSVLVKVEEQADPNEVAARIQARIPGAKVIVPSYLVKKVTAQLESTTHILYLITGSVIFVSLPLIALISSMVAAERRGEIGMLRALGATRLFIFQLIFLESTCLSIFGGLLGIVTSFVILFSFQDLITLTLQVPLIWPNLWEISNEIALALVLAISIGSLSGLYPAYRSCMLEPSEAIRKGII